MKYVPIYVACLALLTILAPAHAAPVALEKGDHLCLVGNELGERMQHHNYWEALLYQRFPEKGLVVRNLCFPGDEPFERIRSLNFGTPDDHLKHSKADVILYFFGFNESFAGKKGLPKFTDEITKLVEETKAKDYSGKGSPRIVLVSPIAFEETGDPNLPDGKKENANLAAYTEALKSVAEKTGVGFVDLFTPTKKLFDETDEQLTFNGAHLTDAGYKALAPILDEGLFGTGGPESIDPAVKAQIDDKNFHWWHRYRAVNGYSIYGKRGEAGSDGTYNNRDVMERERAILDQMAANRDQRIWAVAQGKDVPEKVDDSNTLPFLSTKTNVGGPDDLNAKRGKLGSLDYLSAAEQQKKFKLAPGYQIDLVASEEQFPELANPVSMNFDNAGRLWVSVMPSYPHWQPKSTMDDKLLILEDTDGDHRADECKVFASGLHQPTGFEFGQGGVYVAEQPDILFLKDENGDDVADTRVRRIAGLDSADSHHGPAGFEWGPGGNLYFQEGTFKFSQLESPYGPKRMQEAGVWRFNPKTGEIERYIALSFSNPWGHVFDRWGQDFIADASPGFNYWAAPFSGKIDYPLKHPGGSQHRRVAKESPVGGDPQFQAPTFIKKRTRPSAGCELISSRHFAPEDQGDYLLTNVIGDRSVLMHGMKDEGSGFVGTEKTPLVYGEDGNFRPVDLQFAPDGSLYIVDWHNALIGHLQHNLRDPSRDHSHGRIWRITHKDRPLVEPVKIEGEPIPALLEVLKEPEDRTRYRARRELAERDPKEVVKALDYWTKQLDDSDPDYEHHLLEALWAYQTQNVVRGELLKQLLEAKDPRARAAATRVLSFWMDRVNEPLELVRARINDEHPRVRLEAVRALSFAEGDEAMELALEVLNNDVDDYLQYTLDETMRSLEQ
ncbi:GDSL-like Lipase/Acylhydrolase [Planctomycetes bacterium Pan216]|uniref:GDSL-like Lipase/Acylhydrolase n=1 Tax=Kolteria novifilia TaxID=2527975 RepID=A0A518B4K3_9BACT|nr:GDSL-like Lipase/Acylhydrolase [Planctomycetes bacterium Pan216]